MNLFEMSISGGMLIIICMIFRKMVRNKLPQRVILLMWDCVLIRLWLPFSVPSNVSIYSSFIDSAETKAMSAYILRHNFQLYKVIWLIGFAVMALAFGIAYLCCQLQFAKAVAVQNPQIDSWLAKHKLRRTIQVKQTPRVQTPCTYGIFRPVILLPLIVNQTDKGLMEHILLHEYVHIKHWDTLRKMLLAMTLCIHWFNPLVWVYYFYVHSDIELSCDENVIESIGLENRESYALSLISMAELKSRANPLANYFRQEPLKERVEMIMKMKKKTIGATLVSACLLAIVCTCGILVSKAETLPTFEAPFLEECDIKPNSYYCPEDYKIDGQVVLAQGYYEALPLLDGFTIYVPIDETTGERLSSEQYTDGTVFEIDGKTYQLHIDNGEYSVSEK